MPEDESQSSGPAMSDVVQACIRMTGAGIAIAVLPYALATGLVVSSDGLYNDHLLGDDDLTVIARVLLLCTLVAGAGVVAVGVRAAWRVRAMRGSPRSSLRRAFVPMTAPTVPRSRVPHRDGSLMAGPCPSFKKQYSTVSY